MSDFGGSSGVRLDRKSGSPSYDACLLETARDRVEEEIAANDFVRGAWRELRRRAG